MVIDTSKIKVGDKITVELLVSVTGVGRFESGVYAAPIEKPLRGYYYVEAEAIVGHTRAPRKVEVGATFNWGSSKSEWEIVAIGKGSCWCRAKGAPTYTTFPVSVVEKCLQG